jgi:Carbohydrate esterase 2 N-terminal/GDSL-like Lipase/Acylhydrolase family
MKQNCLLLALIAFQVIGFSGAAWAGKLIPPNNPNIQYFGRWDMADSLHPRYSWPGIYVCTEFSGTSIGIRLADGTDYFNVYIDGKLHGVFHGTNPAETDYILADSLQNMRHTFLLSRRNITFDKPYTFYGIILDNDASLFPPPPKPSRKIEFIGDSFTAGESDEATVQQLEWEARFPVTNIDKGFAPLIAKHFSAQYTTTCRSGAGLYCDWQGNVNETIPKRFNRTLMETSEPKWDFKQWVPDVVVVCLGLNDHSGLKDKDGKISDEKSAAFQKTYHDFLDTVRRVYPNVKIVTVAAFHEWIRTNVKKVVDDETASGKNDIYYAQFDEFPGGYVAYGHPTVETHRKMADQIINAMESFNLFQGTSGK